MGIILSNSTFKYTAMVLATTGNEFDAVKYILILRGQVWV